MNEGQIQERLNRERPPAQSEISKRVSYVCHTKFPHTPASELDFVPMNPDPRHYFMTRKSSPSSGIGRFPT